jgi:hypothetical protein
LKLMLRRLHENLGTDSASGLGPKKTTENDRIRGSQGLPDAYRILAFRPAFKWNHSTLNLKLRSAQALAGTLQKMFTR